MPASNAASCYEAVIRAYVEYRRNHPDRHIDHCLTQPSLLDTVVQAAQSVDHSGKIHPHQCRVGRKRLAEWGQELSSYTQRIRAATTFEGILDTVHYAAQNFSGGGIGELTIYDTAHRIGEKMGLPPKKIYLHSGTRSGAAILVKTIDKSTASIEASQLPPEFHKLAPTELEDILCMYKGALQKCADSSHSPPTYAKPRC